MEVGLKAGRMRFRKGGQAGLSHPEVFNGSLLYNRRFENS